LARALASAGRRRRGGGSRELPARAGRRRAPQGVLPARPGARPAARLDRSAAAGGRIRVMTVIRPQEGETVQLGGLGVRFIATGEGFALVEHPIAPRTLAAPMHVHQHEDEYSYVLEGEVGVQIGDDVHYARPGDLVVKPRGI